jgi:hypothetical protein
VIDEVEDSSRINLMWNQYMDTAHQNAYLDVKGVPFLYQDQVIAIPRCFENQCSFGFSKLQAYDKIDGSLKWEFALDNSYGHVRTAKQWGNGAKVILYLDKGLICFELRQQEVLWAWRFLDRLPEGGNGGFHIAISEKTQKGYVVIDQGSSPYIERDNIYEFELLSGEGRVVRSYEKELCGENCIRSRHIQGLYIYTDEDSGDEMLMYRLKYDGKNAGGYPSRLNCYNLTKDRPEWESEAYTWQDVVAPTMAPIVIEDWAFTMGEGDSLYRFDRKTGELDGRLRLPTYLGSYGSTNFGFYDNGLFVHSAWGPCHRVDPFSMEIVWSNMSQEEGAPSASFLPSFYKDHWIQVGSWVAILDIHTGEMVERLYDHKYPGDQIPDIIGSNIAVDEETGWFYTQSFTRVAAMKLED